MAAPTVLRQIGSPGIFVDSTYPEPLMPHFGRVLTVHPDLLKQVCSQVKMWMHPEAAERESQLRPPTREVIALAVSASNICRYCANSHTAALKNLGADDPRIGEVMAIEAYSR